MPSGPGLLGGRMQVGGADEPPASFRQGARDESSVLFSVKDLASAAALRKSIPPAQAAEAFGDDPTGMVDLRAIAHHTQSSLAIKPLDIAALRPSVVPMAAQHPSSMWPTQEDPAAAAKAASPKGPLFYVAIAAAALVFVGFGAGLTAWGMSSDGDGLSAASTTPPAPDSDVIERDVVQRTKVADSAETAAPAAAAHHGGARHGGAHYGGGGKASSSKSSSKTSSAPKKGSDPCNCHGVLACAMRCTK